MFSVLLILEEKVNELVKEFNKTPLKSPQGDNLL